MTRETSRAAAESVRDAVPVLRERVYQHVCAAGAYGVTCDEAEGTLSLRHQTCSARFCELHTTGRIVDSTCRRRTRSGRAAIVWIKRPSRADVRGWLFT